MKIGYPCSNLSVACSTARTFRLASWSPDRLVETVSANLACLREVLAWNADHGIGFNPRYVDRIFKIFNRLQRNKPGTGIGLAICKKIVQRHDGELTAHAEPGVGATFSAFFPYYEDTEDHGKAN